MVRGKGTRFEGREARGEFQRIFNSQLFSGAFDAGARGTRWVTVMNGIQFILELSYVAARRRSCTGVARRAASRHWTRSKMGLRRNWKAEFSLYPLSARETPHSLFLPFFPPPSLLPSTFLSCHFAADVPPIQNRIYLYIFGTAKYKVRNKNERVKKKMYHWQRYVDYLLRDNKSRLISDNANENSSEKRQKCI